MWIIFPLINVNYFPLNQVIASSSQYNLCIKLYEIMLGQCVWKGNVIDC